MKIAATKPKEREIKITLSVDEAQMLADILYDDSNTTENDKRGAFGAECMNEIAEAIENG